MKFPVSKLAFAVASLALLTFAQPRASFAQTTGNSPARPRGTPGQAGRITVGATVISSGFGGIRAIAGEPFSAEEESERSQVLADGTHVSQTTQIHIYRDSEGRTRNETQPAQFREGHAPGFVQIYDPVAKVRYMLDLQRHVAHVIPTPEENRARLEPSSADTTDQSQPTSVQRAPLRTNTSRTNTSRTGTSQTSTDPSGEPLRRRISHVSLGTQTFEGIETTGLQTTITIPVGAEGNDRPIEIVCENWESAELKLQMLSKCTDPLHGDHTNRIASIDRSEPDASLFQVPPDFQIEEPQTRSATDATTTTER